MRLAPEGPQWLKVNMPGELRKQSATEVVRKIVTMERGPDGLYIQPDELTPDLAVMVEHNRMRMAAKWEYADEFGCGNGHTVDITGKYNCGGCNQANGTKCLAVYDDEPGKALTINLQKGSCGKYEVINPGDPELATEALSAEVANYGVRKGGGTEEVFGCPQCPFAQDSKWRRIPGRAPRQKWCGKGGADVTLISCCTINGAPVVAEESEQEESEEYAE